VPNPVLELYSYEYVERLEPFDRRDTIIQCRSAVSFIGPWAPAFPFPTRARIEVLRSYLPPPPAESMLTRDTEYRRGGGD